MGQSLSVLVASLIFVKFDFYYMKDKLIEELKLEISHLLSNDDLQETAKVRLLTEIIANREYNYEN